MSFRLRCGHVSFRLGPRGRRANYRLGGVLSMALAAALALPAGCSSAPTPTTNPTPPITTEPSASVGPSANPLDQMVSAFGGGLTREKIKTKVDAALRLYGLELTSENYSRAGSTLVALQESAKGRGCSTCTAVAILDEIIRHGRLGGSTFEEAAALATTGLELGPN